uniref:Potassium channel domain-containing protein n=1 Tax=Anopheles coluzzii TaxID=1518534 RepID=A0A6E8VJV2_ANOCL
MSSRRTAPPPMQQLQPQMSISYGEPEKKPRSKCMSFVCCMWKVFTCIFSHVTLVATVVAYCFLGAFTFEHLEAENERNVKKGISSIRVNLTDAIWKMTNDRPVLHQQNWTSAAIMHLQSFEKEILTAMKKDGWDGNEDVDQIQWTFFGALFYSIIVITTISVQAAGTNLRRSVRNSQRSADSGFDPYYEPGLSHSYSDTDYMDDDSPCKTPILCNKYALDDVDDQDGRSTRPNPRSQSMPRQTGRYGDRLMPDRMPYYTEDNEIAENMQSVRKSAPQRRREPRPVPAPSPRIMSPMGFAVHRQARHLQNVIDDNSLYDDEWDLHSGELPPSSIVRPVPIWLCVFLVVSYIIAGAFMFSEWEEWSFLDSAYFCFITLTTIGFGDFVPAQGVKNDSEISIALCSLYLLFGIALLAMSFNLVQEEVISNVKSVARRLGILKEEELDD